MHLLATSSASIDDLVEPIDLRQPPGDIVILSFADSDLAGLAVAWAEQRDILPTVRLANLRDLRHPLSVDLWLESVGQHAKVVVVRLLGGLDWWRYGVERLSSLARERSIALAILPGEDRDDPRLAEASTLPDHELDALLRFFREGGPGNWDPCFGGSRIMQARTSMCPSRVRCRAWPDTSRAKAPSILIGLSGSVGAIGRASRSCSIARCCWRPTRRRSMRCVER